MSSAAPEVAAASTEAGTSAAPVTGRQAVRAGWRRLRWFLVVALVVLLAAVITALTASVSGTRDRLGPDNPAPEGSRALVQVLRRQGVDVQAVRRSTNAVTATKRTSTLVVTRTTLLGPEQLDRLQADRSSNLVLVEPDEFTLSRLAPQVRTAGRRSAVNRAPGCSVAAAEAAGTVRAGGALYSLTEQAVAGSSEAGVCYLEPDTSGVGSFVTVQSGGRTVTVIGQSDILTNEYFDAGGNAALGLWALGEQSSLVWYSPDPLEPAGAGQQRTPLTELLPDWVFWVLLQLVVTVVVVMLWRARRLGPLVPEPLPVVVRAAETQEGRARLYRQASARGRAAATLRTTTLRRLADRLAAPAGTGPDQLVTLASRATGRDPAGEAALHQLLLGPAPESDNALIRLADDLDTVERELSRNRPVRST